MLLFPLLATPDEILDRQMKQSQTHFNIKNREHADFMRGIEGRLAQIRYEQHIDLSDTVMTHILNRTESLLTSISFDEDPGRSAAYIGKVKWATPNYKDAFEIANAIMHLTAAIGLHDTMIIVDSIEGIYLNSKIQGRYVRFFRLIMDALTHLKQEYGLTNGKLQEIINDFTQEILKSKPAMYLSEFYEEMLKDE